MQVRVNLDLGEKAQQKKNIPEVNSDRVAAK